MSAPAIVESPEIAEAVIDRQGMANRTIAFIRKAQSKIVVLHGKHASGKTDLLTRLVVPGLRNTLAAEGRQVLYGECAPGLPSKLSGHQGTRDLVDALNTESVIILDSFEKLLVLPREERREALDYLFHQLSSSHPRAVVVLVTDTRQLTSVYALTSYDPEITKSVLELKAVGIVDGLRSLSHIDPETAATCSEEVEVALGLEVAQMEEQGWDVTFSLIKLVDARLRRLRHETGKAVVTIEDFRALGGLVSILEDYLWSGLEQRDVEHPGTRDLGHAILERVYDAGARGTSLDLADLPPQLGVSRDEIESVLARLAEDPPLLHAADAQSYELVPPQLGRVLKEDAVSSALNTERPRRIVEEGFRTWQLLGTLLSPQRFEDVHRARTQLTLSSAEARFLLLCALRHDDIRVTQYWLARLSDRVDRIDILLSGLFDQARTVRLRSAELLQGFAEPIVRDRLYALAINDPEPVVRAQAIRSLDVIRDDALMELAIREVQNQNSPRRTEAVEVLRIFPVPRVAQLLQALVNDPTSDPAVRDRAIRALSLLDLPEAIESLVDIGLRDPDEDDRRTAASALASIRSVKLNRHLISRLRGPSGSARKKLGSVAVAILAILGATVFWTIGPTLFVFAIQSGSETMAALLSGLALLLTIAVPCATGLLLARLRQGRIRKTRAIISLTVALFITCAVSVFFMIHGLAHLLIGRWRRALMLFGLELLGLGLGMFAKWFAQASPLLGVFIGLVGFTVFFGSYLFDFLAVMGELRLSERALLENRRSLVYQYVFANPVFTEAVYDELGSPDPAVSHWAKEMFRRFGAYARSDQLVTLLQQGDEAGKPLVLRALRRRKNEDTVASLEQLWPTADGDLRKRIAATLYRKPTQRSLQALDRLRSDMPLGLRLRSYLAPWSFRLAVWPLPVQLGVLLLVLTAAVFIIHGYNSVKNPGWSLMMRLKPPLDQVVSGEQKAAIVNFLVDQYPDQPTLRELRKVFQSRLKPDRPEWDELTAALTHAVLKVHGDHSMPDEVQEHRNLVKAVSGFGALLSEDSLSFERSLGVLQAAADARDEGLADTAAMLMINFALQDSSDSGQPRRLQTIDSVSAIRYDRALPALDRIFRVQPGRAIGDRVRQNITRITTEKYAAGQGKDLEAVVPRLGASAPLVTALAHQLSEALVDANLGEITAHPDSEAGYRDLLNRFVRDSQLTRAHTILLKLKKEYPGSLWPRKVLAELYHEYLALDSAAYFLHSYQEMDSLRQLPAYSSLKERDTANYYRFEADFVEVLLSARRFEDTETVGQELIALTRQDVYRLNMALFIYMAKALSRDRSGAEKALNQLEQVAGTLPENFYNGWIYPGTREFINRSGVAPPLKQALLDLCKERSWYDRKEASKVFAQNRSALGVIERPNPELSPLTLEQH